MQNRVNWTDDELATAWIRRYSTERRLIVSVSRAEEDAAAVKKLDEETFWAFDALHDLVLKEPDHAWKLILQILQRSHDDEAVLDNLAAGPLEGLLGQHGRTVVKWVEDEARRNPKFKELLTGVWQNGMPELIWQRVQRAAER